MNDSITPEAYQEIADQVIGYCDQWEKCGEIYMKRQIFVEQFSWGIINPDNMENLAEMLKSIGGFGLSIGCGKNTIVERALMHYGIEFILTDPFEKNETKIVNMDSIKAVKNYGHIVNFIMLSWPAYNDSFAYDSLINSNEIEYVFYIGECEGGCTGDDNFHDYLNSNYELMESFYCNQWDGIHDMGWLYKKK